MNERRLARLAQQIKQRLAQVLQQEIADPKLGLVTITRVELDKEFTRAKAYWSVLAATGKEERARRDSEAVLERARGFCQREMGRVLHTRTIPHLEFHFDAGIGGAIQLNKLIAELRPNADADDGSEASDGGDPGTGQSDPDEPTGDR